MTPRRSLIGRKTLWLTGCMVVGHALAGAAQEPLDLDLPAGPLGDTLIHLARQAKKIISYEPQLVAGRSAPAIRGRLSLDEALKQAVACCGLVVESTPGGTLTVVAAAAGTLAAPAAAPAAAAASASAAASPVLESPYPVLPRVEIIASPRQVDGLRPVRSWSATRTDTPLAELSQAVGVLTPDALALQNGNTVVEAMHYVSGVTAVLDNTGSAGFAAPSLLVRGLNAAFALSGLRTLAGGLPIDLAFVERVEVPKGPSALLGNVVDARGRGGMVNLVLKEADNLPSQVVTQSLSSRNSGTLRVSADLGGAWGGAWDDSAPWRLVGYASQSGRTDGGYLRQGSVGAMATGTLRSGPLSATWRLQSERRRDTPSAASRGGAALVDGTLADVPVQRGQIDPPDPGDRVLTSAHVGQLHLRWNLSPQWRMTLASMVEQRDGDLRRHQPFTAPQQQAARAWNVNTQWSLTGDLRTGPVRHTVLLGLDANRWSNDISGVAIEVSDPGNTVALEIQQSNQGLVLQDQMAMGPWRLRVAAQRARLPAYDLVTRSARDPTGMPRVRTVPPLLATNWDGGLLYQWSPALALYSGFQYSIEDDIGTRPGGSLANGSPALNNATVHQLQAGLKGQGFDRRMSWTAEAFRMRQANVVLLGDGQPGDGRSINGLEFELMGRPVPSIDLNLGLTVLHAIDTVPVAGAAPSRVRAAGLPRRSMHLLGRYHLPAVLGERSSVGVALNASSSSLVGTPGLRPADVRLPGGAQLDLSWDRAFGPWHLNASVRNVFDRQLYGTAADTRYIPLLPERSVGLAVRYED